MSKYKVIGARAPKVDAVEKITGRAKFVEDIVLPGMLWGAILRSPYPHAKILRIDTSRAEKLIGVKAVVTAKDTPGKKYIHVGPPLDDRLPIQSKKVRYIGDEVAAVAATDMETAMEALKLIDVEYEELHAVFDPEEAMAQDSIDIHEGKEKNIAAAVNWEFGDIESGFADADLILEDRFSTPAQSHCVLEPHGTVASYNGDRLTIWTSTQSPYFVRKELAQVLDMEPADIRIKELHSAGAFGARSKICDDEAIAAFLSRKCNRPVKIILTRQEELTTTRVRHPFIIYLKTGYKNDGTIVARQTKVINDNGAYNNVGPSITGYSGLVTASHYRVSNVKFEGYTVYTNKQFGGPYRGFGSPQVTFAIESHMDEAAQRLGLDPAEIRLKNSNLPEEETACGWKVTTCGMKECIEAVKKSIDWEAPRKPGVGKGIATMIHVGGGARIFRLDGDFATAIIHVDYRGKVKLLTGISDCGTYAITTMCQIIAEVLGVDISDIHCISMDTDLTPPDLGAYASKTAFMAGNAVKLAAEDAKRQITEAAAKVLEVSADDLMFSEGKISSCSLPEKVMSLGEAVDLCNGKVGNFIIGKGHYESPTELVNRVTGNANISAAYSFAAQAVELEVDKKTGVIHLRKFVAAHDVGKALNANAVEGQIQGAVAQGIGLALCEEQIYQEGRVITDNFHDHRAVTSMDVPLMETIIIETNDQEGPFGAKGAGEPGLIPTAPAIANAVYDAIGVRVKDLPLKPEKIIQAQKSEYLNKRNN